MYLWHPKTYLSVDYKWNREGSAAKRALGFQVTCVVRLHLDHAINRAKKKSIINTHLQSQHQNKVSHAVSFDENQGNLCADKCLAGWWAGRPGRHHLPDWGQDMPSLDYFLAMQANNKLN